MHTFIVFLSGFVGGFIVFVIIRLYVSGDELNFDNWEKRRDKRLQAQEKEDAERKERHKNCKQNNNSKELKIIKLNSNSKSHDSYYNNDEIFATLSIKDMIPYMAMESIPIRDKDDCMEDINKSIEIDRIRPISFEHHFQRVLDSGEVCIYSKMEGKFVDRIMRDEYEFLAGPTSGAGGYNYYLPDGTPFFNYTSWVS